MKSMKKQLFILFALILIASIAMVACGARATEVPAATQPPVETESPTGVPPGSVAILVLDIFSKDDLDDITFTSAQQYKNIVETKKIDFADINSNKNCVHTMQGQAAVVIKGAAAVVIKGADDSPQTLPAPHGDITFEELRSVINRQDNSELSPPTDGISEFGLDWIKTVVYFNNNATNKSIALVAIDSAYTTEGTVMRLQQAIDKLVEKGYSQFVINMSFVILPCPDFTQSETTFIKYQDLIKDPSLEYLNGFLSISTNDQDGSVSFIDPSGDIILTKLASRVNDNLFTDRDGTPISDEDAGILLENPIFGPLRLREYYEIDSELAFNNYLQLLNEDPQFAYLKEQMSSSTDENGNVSFEDQDGNIILTKLKSRDSGGTLFIDKDGNPLSDKYAGLVLADRIFWPLRLSFYKQVLDDPLKGYLKELSASYTIIPVAAAGNEGLPYPYAPAMWNEVLSVGSPIDGKDQLGLQLSSFDDGAGNQLQFKTNSGEVEMEGCTNYQGTQRIPGTSFASPKVSYLAALYLLQGGTVSSCTTVAGATPIVAYPTGINPVPPLGYADADGNWFNMDLQQTSDQYCSAFPASVDVGISCPAP